MKTQGFEASADRTARVARLVSAFGEDAAERISTSTVAVIGAGGTGSPAIEVLARAGVGHLITVDPDHFTESNLERVHGSLDIDVTTEPEKVVLALRHIRGINPVCRVSAIRGRLPQSEVMDAVIHADVVLGCTDNQHSRLALSDLAVRYLVPVIDCGVGLEGASGRITGLLVQLLRLLPEEPCVLCRGMISSVRVTQELMSAEDRLARQNAALAAIERGEAANPYWHEEPQLNTVGFLTTVAGALAATYAIGWISGRFDPPFARLQMNVAAPFFDITDDVINPRGDCVCRRIRGWGDQGVADAMISAPAHWENAVTISTST